MTSITIGGAQLAVETVEDEPRIEDLELARVLEYESPREIRRLIARNTEFLQRQGVLCHRNAKPEPGSTGGRPRKSYWLNKKQALFIAGKSDKPKGAEILLMLVEVFEMAQEQAHREAFEREASKSWVFRQIFLEMPEHTEKLWTVKRLAPIAALYGVAYAGGRAPVETRYVQREIYDLVIGSDLIKALRKKYPDPPGVGDTPYIYDHFHPTVREKVERELDSVALLARTSTTIHDFRAKLKREYGTSMLQLVFGGKNAERWLKPEPVN